MPLAVASLAVSSALATAAAASGGIGERLPYSAIAASAAARPESRPASPAAMPLATASEASGGMGDRLPYSAMAASAAARP